MPPTIPQPLFVSGGYRQRPAAEQLLLTLASQLPQLGFSFANYLQDKSAREQTDYNAQRILENRITQGLVDPRLAATIPGLETTTPSPTAPGKAQLTGDPAGSADLLKQIIGP